MKLYPILVFCVLSTVSVNSQDISVQQYLGSYITSVSKAGYLKDSYSYFTEAAFIKPIKNEQTQWGIGAFFGNTGSRQYIGNMGGAFPYLNFRLFNFNSFQSSIRAGMGAAYVQLPYDVNTNHKNVLIGSHLNVFINFLWLNKIKLSDHVSLIAGLSLSHLSNANTKLPNLGLNIPSISTGVSYTLKEKENKKSETVKIIEKRTEFYAHISAGIKQYPWIESKRYMPVFAEGAIQKPTTSGNSYGGGIAFFHDASQQHLYLDTIVTLGKSINSPWNCGPFISYEKRVGKFSIPVQFGAYIFYSEAGQLFQNIGIKYYLNRNWSVGGYLLAHWGKADFMHAGIDYIF